MSFDDPKTKFLMRFLMLSDRQQIQYNRMCKPITFNHVCFCAAAVAAAAGRTWASGRHRPRCLGHSHRSRSTPVGITFDVW